MAGAAPGARRDVADLDQRGLGRTGLADLGEAGEAVGEAKLDVAALVGLRKEREAERESLGVREMSEGKL